eukprot:scaffold320628_cov19-Tisochrysis_lutea.AAC.1
MVHHGSKIGGRNGVWVGQGAAVSCLDLSGKNIEAEVFSWFSAAVATNRGYKCVWAGPGAAGLQSQPQAAIDPILNNQ